jgi:phosphoserine aminotransferase
VLEYATIAKNNSLYNTLSIFDVYVAGLVLKSLLTNFHNKVDGQQALAEKKAAMIYGALDAYPKFYKVRSERQRSHQSILMKSCRLFPTRLFAQG